MARRYSKKASADVERAMKKRKAGTLKSGRSGRKVPKKASKKRKASKKKAKKSKR